MGIERRRGRFERIAIAAQQFRNRQAVAVAIRIRMSD